MSDKEQSVEMEVLQKIEKKEKGVQKRIKFEKGELDRLQALVIKNPQLEKKEHDKDNEKLKKQVWVKVCEEYNADSRNTKRTGDQLKNAWKRIKKEWKNDQAAIRRSKFKTGGGPPSPLKIEDTQNDVLMKDLLSEQQPLENIPDDDFLGIPDDEELDEGSNSSVGMLLQTPGTSTPLLTLGTATSIEARTPSRGNSDQVQGKRTTKKMVSFAEQFHNKKMEYLKAEHDLKMEVLRRELNYWKVMERNAYSRRPTGTQQPDTHEETSETTTARLFYDAIIRD